MKIYDDFEIGDGKIRVVFEVAKDVDISVELTELEIRQLLGQLQALLVRQYP